MTDEETTAVGTRAALRVADLLEALMTADGTVGVSEMATQLGLSKSVVHRLLSSLADRQFVSRDPATRRYQLGPAFTAIGVRAIREFPLRDAAEEQLYRLQAETGETAALSTVVGTCRVYVHQVVSHHPIRMELPLGVPVPLYAGASGKVMLASSPTLIQRILSQGLTAVTDNTVTDPAALEADLRKIAADGYAISFGERQEGSFGVAAPLFGLDGRVAGAVSVSGPRMRYHPGMDEHLIDLIVTAAHSINEKLKSAGRRELTREPGK